MSTYQDSDIEKAIDFLADYFGRKLKPRIKAYYLQKIKGYDPGRVKKAIDNAIENGFFDRFPRLPDLKLQLDKFCQRQAMISYDREDDPRFPVEKLWKGFEILRDHGTQRFNNYCDSVQMPAADRRRILDKVNMAFNANGLVDGMLNGVDEKTKDK